MSEVTTWTDGLSAAAVKSAKAKAEAIDSHVTKGNREYGLAALDLELVHRHYLKGDKARLVAFCQDQVRGIKASMAYVYVQAGRVLRAPETVGLTAETAQGMAVQALAILDRYIVPGDSEAQAEATKEAVTLVTTNRSEAEAEGTKPLTAEGLRETVKAIRAEAEGEAPTDPTDRKVGNIASKLRDSLALAIGQCEARRTEKGPLAGWYAMAKWCADNSQFGPLTGQAVERLYGEAMVAKAQADKAEAKAKAQAERTAAAVSALKGDDKAETAKVVAAVAAKTKVRAKVTEAPKAKAPKRSNRPVKAPGIKALTEANAPANGK